jgi:hypothetical protein
MNLRLVPLFLLTLTLAIAGDGIPPRGSAEGYPAHDVSGKVAVGAALVSPAQVKKLFGEDLDKRGYVVFEIGMFPIGDTEVEVSPDDFKLRQGEEGAITRAATPHMVASDIHPQPSPNTQIPSKVQVQTTDTIGIVRASNGRTAVYTDTSVSVGNRPTAAPPSPTTQSTNNDELEQRIDEKSLPDVKTKRAAAGYVFFPKPVGDKHADYELLYFGFDGQVTLRLPATTK